MDLPQEEILITYKDFQKQCESLGCYSYHCHYLLVGNTKFIKLVKIYNNCVQLCSIVTLQIYNKIVRKVTLSCDGQLNGILVTHYYLWCQL